MGCKIENVNFCPLLGIAPEISSLLTITSQRLRDS